MPSLRYVLVFTGYEFATMPVYKKLLKYAVGILEELFVSHHPAGISANRVVLSVLLRVSRFYEFLVELCNEHFIRNLSYRHAVSATVCVITADCQGKPFSVGITARCFLLIQIIRAMRLKRTARARCAITRPMKNA